MSDYWGDEGQPVCPMVFLSPKGGSIIPFFLEPSQVLDPSRAHWGTFLYAGPGGGNMHNVLNPLRQHYSRLTRLFFIKYEICVYSFIGSGPMGQLQGQFQNSALLSQQAQSLLEEARNENRILEDNVSTLKEQV